MGSRWKSGAVPATVSGEPLPSKWGDKASTREPGDLPSPSSAPGRDQPAVRGAAAALRPRGSSETTSVRVVSRRIPHVTIHRCFSPIAVQAQTEIIVTAAREPVEAEDSGRFRHRARRGRARGLSACRRRRTCCGLSPGVVGRDHRPARHPDPAPHPRRRGQSHPALRRRHPLQRSRRRQRGALRAAHHRRCCRGSRSCAGRNRRCGAREALGGVIAVETADPLPRRAASRALGEYGSLDSARLSGRYALRTGDVGIMRVGRLAAQRRHRLVRRRRRARRLRQSRREPEGRGAAVGRDPSSASAGHWIEGRQRI